MTALLAVFLNPRVLGAIAVTALLTFGYFHYTGLKADLVTAQEDASSARAASAIAIGVAKGNREQLEKAQAQHRFTLGVLADLEAEKDARGTTSSHAEADILTAPPEANPPVPGVLERLRQNRFGGRGHGSGRFSFNIKGGRDATSPWPTCVRALALFAAVLVVLALAGCAHRPEPQVIPQVVERRIEIPDALLRCLPEPVAQEAWRLSSDSALFMNRLADAGADCREKLSAVKRLIDSQ